MVTMTVFNLTRLLLVLKYLFVVLLIMGFVVLFNVCRLEIP